MKIIVKVPKLPGRNGRAWQINCRNERDLFGRAFTIYRVKKTVNTVREFCKCLDEAASLILP